MDYYDIKPTEENLVKEFDNDVLGRKAEMISIIRILDAVDDNYTISLDAPWGAGKTFFVKQAVMILNGVNKEFTKNYSSLVTSKQKEIANNYTALTAERYPLKQDHLAIYFDAWSYDDFEEPVLAIIYNVIRQLDLSENELTSLDLDSVISCFMDLIGLTKGKEILKGVLSAAANLKPKDILKGVKERSVAREKIDAFFSKLISKRGARCVIFIDELDRCNPMFAVKLLERIKHYFTCSQITFVFSTNLSELSNTIRCQYGDQFDADRYLDRFFDLRLALQTPRDIRRYLVRYGYRNDGREDETMLEMIKYCHFSLREINHYLKIMHIANGLHRDYQLSGERKILIHQCLVPILIALKISSADSYHEFITGGNESLFIDLAYAHISKDILDRLLPDDSSISNDSRESNERKALRNLYHSLFTKNGITTDALFGIKAGSITFYQDDIDDMEQTINILSGAPSIAQVKRKNYDE